MHSLYYKEEKDFELYSMDSRHIRPHLHKNIEFAYCLEGSLTLGIGTTLYRMEKNDLAVIFPEQVHHYQSFGEQGRVLFLQAAPSLGGSYIQAITTLVPEKPIISAENVHPDIYYAMETLGTVEDHPQKDVLHEAYVMIILARIMPFLKLTEKKTGSGDDMIYRVISYISEHYTEENLTLSRMAHDLYVSQFALSRMFSEIFRMNFNRYLNITRLEYVRYLLEYTDQSITEAYENAGFGSQRTFNRVFREHFHMTPKEFRALK